MIQKKKRGIRSRFQPAPKALFVVCWLAQLAFVIGVISSGNGMTTLITVAVFPLVFFALGKFEGKIELLEDMQATERKV